MTAARASAERCGAAGGLASPSPRPRRSGSRARSPAGCSTRAGAPGAVVLARIAIGALCRRAARRPARCADAGALLRRNAGLLLFGAVPVAGAQFGYFSAVAADGRRPGAADRVHGARRRGRLAVAAPRRAPRPADGRRRGLAALGLVLVLDLLSGADLASAGVLWALVAMVCAASYFVLAADARTAAAARAGRAGLAVGALGSGCSASSAPADARDDRRAVYAGTLRLVAAVARPGVVTAALAYSPGSRRAGGSARGCPRSWRCWRSSRRDVRVAAARPAPGPAAARSAAR